MRALLRPAALVLPLLAGAWLATAPAEARVVQQGQPPAAESGGQPVPAAGAATPGCTTPVAVQVVCALAAPFALGAFGWWMQAEEVVRMTAAARLQITSERATWRAPRLAARLAARRAAIERKRLSHRN